jgi:hypothetical protein
MQTCSDSDAGAPLWAVDAMYWFLGIVVIVTIVLVAWVIIAAIRDKI